MLWYLFKTATFQKRQLFKNGNFYDISHTQRRTNTKTQETQKLYKFQPSLKKLKSNITNNKLT